MIPLSTGLHSISRHMIVEGDSYVNNKFNPGITCYHCLSDYWCVHTSGNRGHLIVRSLNCQAKTSKRCNY